MVMVRVRHSCRRLVAEVGRDDQRGQVLLVGHRGRDIVEVPADWSLPVVWSPASRTSPSSRPVPVLCDRCPNARPFLWPAQIAEAVERARVRGGPVDLVLDDE